jgi:FtsP/CotA-like multicopper oxidase with cupredoxin domain
MVSRRIFLQSSVAAAVAASLNGYLWPRGAFAATQGPGLSDPALQPKFATAVPNALDPGFMFDFNADGEARVGVGQSEQYTGLIGTDGQPVKTTVWGYGQVVGNPKKPRVLGGYTWPGRTIVAQSGEPLEVRWENLLVDNKGDPLPPIITGKDNTSLGYGDYTGRSVIDESLHWAYSLNGYTQYDVENHGIPIVPHVHGGHTDFLYDGNPEFFFSPFWKVRGPQWREKTYIYDNSQPAGTVWYHDHALGITRLNVYAGMAGFYIIRDDQDTGLPDNPLGLPAFPYEAAFAIQDKMFKDDGELFYPAFPGDPFYDDFITGEDAILPPGTFPGGGPTGLAEFFGDHMVVNGAIWPYMEVEPRNYRLRFLNGCDSRFLAVQFFEVPAGEEDFSNATGPLPFSVIGSDQGLASAPTMVDTLLMETGSRYDVIFDFKTVTSGNRVIMRNLGGDDPFGGGILMPGGERAFPEMEKVMAFDVVLPFNSAVSDATPNTGNGGIPIVPAIPTRTRKVALFEGKDEFDRLQPLLGTAEPATDYSGAPVNWPATEEYAYVGLVGQMEGSIAWHSPTTENPALDSTEEWEVWNVTGDAHPVHLHLVHFEILGRQELNFDSNADEDGFIPEGMTPADDGVYLVPQPTVQHNSVAGQSGTYGIGFRIVHPTNPSDAYGPVVSQPAGYVENAPKDMVTALPGQITRIKATFDKPGRYVWHCHILSHEDHEMMRVMHVGPGA